MRKLLCLIIIHLCIGFAIELLAQLPSPNFIVGDALPSAPELAPRGKYSVGVRTIEVVNKNQVDVLKSKAGVDPLYDRSLT